jgi:5'-3' exonuclease
MTKLLIDGDLFAFRCAASAENENAHIAASRMETLLDQCLRDTGCDEFEFFISGPTNFRYNIYPEYKAHRIEQKRPQFLTACKDYLKDVYNAQVSDNCEADDLMAIAQTAATAAKDTVICSLDKDMLQVPGMHYSWEISGGTQDKRWVKPAILQEITPIEGLRKFYSQLLKGDTADNIKGVQGIGPVKADKMLAGLETEEEMFDVVLDAYGFPEIMLMNGQVLWLQRQPGEIWRLPFEREV